MLLAAILALTTSTSSATSPLPEPYGPNIATLQRDHPVWQLARGKIESNENAPWLQRVQIGDVMVKKMEHGPQDRLEMAITVDDGPHGEKTWQLLQMLEETQTKATFFLVGKMTEGREEIVRAMHTSGHSIANHTFSHPNLAELGTEDILTEYKAAQLSLEGITGEQPRYCRPPGGRMDNKTLKAASALGLTTVYWNCNPGDYKFDTPQPVLDRLRNGRAPGAIVLIHSGVGSSIDALRAFILESKAMGYSFVLLDEWVDNEQERIYKPRPSFGHTLISPGKPLKA